MRCPHCERELEEGKFYCPDCGYEIQIVSDFEPEIEDKINTVLEDISNDFEQDIKKLSIDEKHKEDEKRAIIYSLIAAGVLLVFLCVGYFIISSTNTTESLLAKADKLAAKGSYDKAIECMLKVVEKDKTNMKYREFLGDYYLKADKTGLAIVTFQDIIDLDGENEDAYERLISIYEANGDYDSINLLIRSSSSPRINNAFSRYIANAPEFNYPQGTYSEILSLKLSSNSAGKIYYTIDGKEPTEKDLLYQTPILLDDGIYTIKALFVNEYGIQSEIATQIYQIHLEKAHEPEISLEEGDYTEPQMITVTVPSGESVYYTVDGTNPTMDSIPYHNPIALPIGETTYKFVSYSSDGVASPVISKHYMFTFISVLDIHQANDILLDGLIDKELVLDKDGSIPNKNGHNLYICSTVISINQRSYYLFVEYYEDLFGTDSRTGNLYGIDAENGILCRVMLDEKGYYSAVSF